MKTLFVLCLLVSAMLMAGCGEPKVSKADSIEQTLIDAQKNESTANAPPYKPKGSGLKAGDTPKNGQPAGTGTTK